MARRRIKRAAGTGEFVQVSAEVPNDLNRQLDEETERLGMTKSAYLVQCLQSRAHESIQLSPECMRIVQQMAAVENKTIDHMLDAMVNFYDAERKRLLRFIS